MVLGLGLFIGLFNNLALLIVFVNIYGFLLGRLKNAPARGRQVAFGLMFALFVFGCMQVKIPVSEGVFVDQRNAIVILAGTFGGPVSGTVAALAASAYRAYIGGRGVFGGILGITLSALAGFTIHFRRERIDTVAKAALVSVAATIFILPGFLPIGSLGEGWELLKQMALPYGSAISVGLFIGGLLFLNEERRRNAQIRLKASLAEKEILLKEIYHRTNNNMQIISSLLLLQSEAFKDEKVDHLVSRLISRIQAVSLVYEKLSRSKDLSRIGLRGYVEDLTSLIAKTEGDGKTGVKVGLDVEDIELIIDAAVPLGLVINEIVTNSFKHAFPDGGMGTVRVTARRLDPQTIRLALSDDGKGFPAGFDPDGTSSFGLFTTLALVRMQLKGTVEIESNHGVSYKITVKDKIYEPRI